MASYGWAAGWDWEDTKVLSFFYLYLAAVGAVEVTLAWWFWRKSTGIADLASRS